MGNNRISALGELDKSNVGNIWVTAFWLMCKTGRFHESHLVNLIGKNLDF